MSLCERQPAVTPVCQETTTQRGNTGDDAPSPRGLVRGTVPAAGSPWRPAGQKGLPGAGLRWIACERKHFQVLRRAGPRQRPGDPPDTDRRSWQAIRRGGLPPAQRSRQSESAGKRRQPGEEKRPAEDRQQKSRRRPAGAGLRWLACGRRPESARRPPCAASDQEKSHARKKLTGA